jgi:hypothetical protein
MAILGILLVFFFPASSGPFSVTNGPATAFRALAAAQGLFAAMGALFVAFTLRSVLDLQSTTQTVEQMNCDPALLALRC